MFKRELEEVFGDDALHIRLFGVLFVVFFRTVIQEGVSFFEVGATEPATSIAANGVYSAVSTGGVATVRDDVVLDVGLETDAAFVKQGAEGRVEKERMRLDIRFKGFIVFFVFVIVRIRDKVIRERAKVGNDFTNGVVILVVVFAEDVFENRIDFDIRV